MKRYGNIYPKIYDMDNLREAHRNARKDKLFYGEVVMVDSNPEYYLSEIHKMLKNKTYQVKPEDYTVSHINDKGKDRELWKLPYYPHRIIQWAIMLQIEGMFDQVFTDFTCASLPDRGISRAYKLVNRYMKDRTGTEYCLKLDIHHFYPSIDHGVLKGMLRKKFKDPDLLELLDLIIDSHPPKGIPIGSYLSQYLANFYLAYFDHWLKEEMKIRYVVRYMDDVVIFHWSKRVLHWLVDQMKVYLDKLKLSLKRNWQIFPTAVRGVDFVGYRYFRGYILLRKKTCKRLKKALLSIRRKLDAGNMMNFREWSTVNSYAGWLIWCDSWRLFEAYVEPVIPGALRYYGEVVKRGAGPKARVNAFKRYQTKLYAKKGRAAA